MTPAVLSKLSIENIRRQQWRLTVQGTPRVENEIALWSADYTQLTGQAAVTERVVHSSLATTWNEYVYCGAGWRSLASWAEAVLRLWCDVARLRVRMLYLVCSRSNGGFLRDVPALLASRAGARVVVHAHGSDIVDLLSCRRLSPLARALYARCEIVVPSAHLLEPLRAVTGATVHLCENYFDTDAVMASGDSRRPATLDVLWNSNVMASKGFFELVEAVRLVRTEGLPMRLIAVGRPLEDEEMSGQEVGRRLDRLASEKWLDYRGEVDQPAMMALTAAADVVCLPSRYTSECQPLAVIQAMCTAKAIVVSDIAALRATVGDYPATFVPVGSPAAIADALRRLHDEKAADPAGFVWRRSAAAAAARSRFDKERFDRQMAAILLPARPG